MSVVDVEQRGRIVLVTLNRPEKRNALTSDMNAALRAAFTQFRDDDELWVAVLAANGADFCAGVDLGQRPSSESAGCSPAPTISRRAGAPLWSDVNRRGRVDEPDARERRWPR